MRARDVEILKLGYSSLAEGAVLGVPADQDVTDVERPFLGEQYLDLGGTLAFEAAGEVALRLAATHALRETRLHPCGIAIRHATYGER